MQVPYRKPGKFSLVKSDPIMTPEKLSELQVKLEKLKAIRPTAAKEVGRLAELGDFSENVEYQLAKGRLRGINDKILKLERQIMDAEIIKPNKNSDRVQIGHKVTIDFNGHEKTYQILGSSESNPTTGTISHLSPLGSALMNKKTGETVKIELAGKTVKYKIVKIQ